MQLRRALASALVAATALSACGSSSGTATTDRSEPGQDVTRDTLATPTSPSTVTTLSSTTTAPEPVTTSAPASDAPLAHAGTDLPDAFPIHPDFADVVVYPAPGACSNGSWYGLPHPQPEGTRLMPVSQWFEQELSNLGWTVVSKRVRSRPQVPAADVLLTLSAPGRATASVRIANGSGSPEDPTRSKTDEYMASIWYCAGVTG